MAILHEIPPQPLSPETERVALLSAYEVDLNPDMDLAVIPEWWTDRRVDEALGALRIHDSEPLARVQRLLVEYALSRAASQALVSAAIEVGPRPTASILMTDNGATPYGNDVELQDKLERCWVNHPYGIVFADIPFFSLIRAVARAGGHISVGGRGGTVSVEGQPAQVSTHPAYEQPLIDIRLPLKVQPKDVLHLAPEQ